MTGCVFMYSSGVQPPIAISRLCAKQVPIGFQGKRPKERIPPEGHHTTRPFESNFARSLYPQSRAVFTRWHSSHSPWRLSAVSVPPLTNALMWSTCVASVTRPFALHITHSGLSRSTWARMRWSRRPLMRSVMSLVHHATQRPGGEALLLGAGGAFRVVPSLCTVPVSCLPGLRQNKNPGSFPQGLEIFQGEFIHR